MNELFLKAAVMLIAAVGILLLFADFKSNTNENVYYKKKYSDR
jgi:hypothetical protein